MKDLEDFGFIKFNKKDYPLLKRSPLGNEGVIENEKGFERVYKSFISKSPFYVISGFRSDIKMHLGYKFLAESLNFFSDLGGINYLINPKTEKLLMGDQINPESGLKKTIFYSFLKNEKRVKIREDKFEGIDKLVLEVASIFTVKDILNRFKVNQEESINRVWGLIYASMSYFLPNLENETRYPTLILGNRSHANLILFANEVARKKNLPPVSALFLNPIPGKDGSLKMSASKPETAIYLEKLNRGIDNIKEGSTFLNCPFYEMGKYFVVEKELNEIKRKCEKKKNCKECKKKVIKKMKK